MAISIEHIARVLAGHSPNQISRATAPRRAAVAAVLRDGERGAEVLLMQRSTNENDRWSGQVSFPGGREEDGDADLVATATRETREEVGVDLDAKAALLGRLDAIRARGRSGITNLSVWPYVFVATEPLAPRASEEAAAVFWLPLDLAVSGRLDSVYHYRHGPVQMKLPSWSYDGHVVWGMTYGMLESFLALLR